MACPWHLLSVTLLQRRFPKRIAGKLVWLTNNMAVWGTTRKWKIPSLELVATPHWPRLDHFRPYQFLKRFFDRSDRMVNFYEPEEGDGDILLRGENDLSFYHSFHNILTAMRCWFMNSFSDS